MRSWKKTVSLLAGASALLGTGAAHAATQQFKGMTLTVLGVNADLNAIYMRTFGVKFEKETGAKLVLVPGSPGDNLSKALLAKGRTPNFQVIGLEDLQLAQAIQADAVQKIKYSRLPASKGLAPGAVPAAEYGPSFDFFRFGTCINVAKYKEHKITIPTSIEGWFDPAIRGHNILPTPANFWWPTGMQALAESQGISFNNPKPLFEKLRSMKPSSLYTASGDAQTALQTGAAWLAPTSDGRCYAMKMAGQPVDFVPLNLKIGGKTYTYVFGVDTWQIPIGVKGKELELAYRFINASLSSSSQVAVAKKFGFEPTMEKGLKMAMELPQAKRAGVYGPGFSFKNMYAPNPLKLLPYLNQWVQEWNSMFTQ